MKKILYFLLLPIIFLSGRVTDAANLASSDLAAINTLDLVTAQRLGLQANPNLAAAQEAVAQARARLEQAAAAWWPNIDLTGSVAKTRLSDSSYQTGQGLLSIFSQNTIPSLEQTYEETSLGIQISYLLFDGFSRDFTETIARLGEESAQADLVDSQRRIALAIAEAFLNTQLAIAGVDISLADRDFYAQQLRDAQNRYQVGAGTHADVVNITIQYNTAQNELLSAQWAREAAGYGLAALLGIPEATLPAHLGLPPLDRKINFAKPLPEVNSLVERALTNRPDLRGLSLAQQSAEASTKQAEGAFYPTIAAGYALNGFNQEHYGLSGDDFSNTVALTMNWNLFHGGADRARITEALRQKGVTSSRLADLRNQVTAEVRQYLAQLTTAREQVRLQRENLALAEENRSLAENEYREGKTSLIRLNEAQRDLTKSQSRLALVLVSFQQAEQRLLGATGDNLACLNKNSPSASPDN